MTTVLLVGTFAVAYILNATELIPRVPAATGGVAASDPEAAAPLSFAPGAALGGNTTTAAGANVVVAAVAAPTAVEAKNSPSATHGSRRLRGG